MSRELRHLVLCLVLLFAQQAAQAHAFTHLRQALKGDTDKSVPVSHATAQCLVFHAVDSALPGGTFALGTARSLPLSPTPVALPLARSPRIEFDSRAPPALS